MKDDPTILRIRKARHQISKRFNHNPKKLIEYYIKLQKRHQDRLIETAKTKVTYGKQI